MAFKEKADAVEFSRQWRPVLLAYFQRRLRHYDDAEDMVQDVLTRLLAKEGEAVDRPDAYIFKIASNLLADRARRYAVRRQYREGLSDDAVTEIDMFDPHRIVSGRLELSAILDRIQHFPERTQTVFILYRFENMHQSDISQALGISVSAVKKHVAKALTLLMRTEDGA